MDSSKSDSQQLSSQLPTDSPVAQQPDHVAWEEIENGRFRPRRIRGSCLGMELG